jgi:hypothetical protein
MRHTRLAIGTRLLVTALTSSAIARASAVAPLAPFGAMASSTSATAAVTSPRRPVIVACKKQLEGGGFPVRRPPIDNVGGLVLLFDHMGPFPRAPGQDFPGPEHPHRGFETIGYSLR